MPAECTLDNVQALRGLCKWEEKHEDGDTPEVDTWDWPRAIETILEWLGDCLGQSGVPLAYVVRDDEDVPTAEYDPPTNYDTIQLEMIARAPIRVAGAGGALGAYHPTFLANRIKVWNMLNTLFRNKECFTYIRCGLRTKDGRMAFRALRDHYLGSANVDNMSSKAESKLQKTEYRGEGRRFNFEKYAWIHKEQHMILDGL